MVKVLRQVVSAIFGIFKVLFDVFSLGFGLQRLGHSGHESTLGGTEITLALGMSLFKGEITLFKIGRGTVMRLD